MAAATVKINQKVKIGGTKALYLGVINGNASYATGGDTVDFTTALGYPGPSKIDFVEIGMTAGFTGEISGGKLIQYVAAGTEVTSTTDTSARAMPFLLIGPG